jgi:hypothetical protein
MLVMRLIKADQMRQLVQFLVLGLQACTHVFSTIIVPIVGTWNISVRAFVRVVTPLSFRDCGDVVHRIFEARWPFGLSRLSAPCATTSNNDCAHHCNSDNENKDEN